MIRLTPKQLTDKIEFIRRYIKAPNAATGSELDANANITHKNVATLMGEINKDVNIQLRRHLIYENLVELFGKGPADHYIKQLENHEIYAHDESCLVQPYCASVDLYPFITNGLQAFGGESKAPKHLSSYCGGFINLIFALSSQFAGAIGTPAFLVYFDYFARKDYGPNYCKIDNIFIRTIKQELQQVVYALEPTSKC